MGVLFTAVVVKEAEEEMNAYGIFPFFCHLLMRKRVEREDGVRRNGFSIEQFNRIDDKDIDYH